MSKNASKQDKIVIKQSIVSGVFLFGKTSATLIIPAEIARQCNLEHSVVVEKKYGGLFIHSPEFESE